MEFDPAPETKRWFISTKPARRQGFACFCFSFVGGQAGWFDDWSDRLSSQVEVVAVMLEQGAEDFWYPHQGTDGCDPRGLDLPFAFFGHGLGALVAFELARALRGGGPIPSCLFVTGRCRTRAQRAIGRLVPVPLPKRRTAHCWPRTAIGKRLRWNAPSWPTAVWPTRNWVSNGLTAGATERPDHWCCTFFPKNHGACAVPVVFDEMARALSPWPEVAVGSRGTPAGISFPRCRRNRFTCGGFASIGRRRPTLSWPSAFRRKNSGGRSGSSRPGSPAIYRQSRGPADDSGAIPGAAAGPGGDGGGRPRQTESAPSPGLLPLRFNLSHSEERALVGITLDQRIGVDVEH